MINTRVVLVTKTVLTICRNRCADITLNGCYLTKVVRKTTQLIWNSLAGCYHETVSKYHFWISKLNPILKLPAAQYTFFWYKQKCACCAVIVSTFTYGADLSPTHRHFTSTAISSEYLMAQQEFIFFLLGGGAFALPCQNAASPWKLSCHFFFQWLRFNFPQPRVYQHK